MDYEEVKQKIAFYKDKEAEKKRNQEKEYKAALEEAMQQIRELKSEIEMLIKSGNLCIQEGIDLNPSNRNHYRKCTYKDKAFETDAIHHQLGFYPNYYNRKQNKCTHYEYIGFRNGGANGNADFITNGILIAEVPHGDCYKPDFRMFKKPSLEHCKLFLKSFNEFKTEFYKFINELGGD